MILKRSRETFGPYFSISAAIVSDDDDDLALLKLLEVDAAELPAALLLGTLPLGFSGCVTTTMKPLKFTAAALGLIDCEKDLPPLQRSTNLKFFASDGSDCTECDQSSSRTTDLSEATTSHLLSEPRPQQRFQEPSREPCAEHEWVSCTQRQVAEPCEKLPKRQDCGPIELSSNCVSSIPAIASPAAQPKRASLPVSSSSPVSPFFRVSPLADVACTVISPGGDTSTSNSKGLRGEKFSEHQGGSGEHAAAQLSRSPQPLFGTA